MKSLITIFFCCLYCLNGFSQNQTSKDFLPNEKINSSKKEPSKIVKTKYIQVSMYKNRPVIERDTMIILNQNEKRNYSYSMKKEDK